MNSLLLVEGETSSFECAHQLGKLCENRHLVVNLIPYNQTDVKDKLRCPSNDHMQQFRNIVASYGTFCTIRRTMGADMSSACGQLVQKREREEVVGDIEDVVGPEEKKSKSMKSNNSAAKSIRRLESSRSWIEALPTNDLDKLENFLTVAAGVSASCFLFSTYLFLKKR